ncbi:MAG: hypothetical protein ACJAUP_001913 [Cellvibrionaceae bacterium]|jgi:hypothetical protein
MMAGWFFIDRYNALVLWQRIALMAALLSDFYFLWCFLFSLLITSKSESLKKEKIYLTSLHEDVSEIEEVKKREGKDLGVASLNDKLNNLKNEVNDLNVQLKKCFLIVSSSDDLIGIVKDLVDTKEGVNLKTIDLLPVERIIFLRLLKKVMRRVFTITTL